MRAFSFVSVRPKNIEAGRWNRFRTVPEKPSSAAYAVFRSALRLLPAGAFILTVLPKRRIASCAHQYCTGCIDLRFSAFQLKT